MTADLADLLEDVEHLVLAFDGPIRAAFAGGAAAANVLAAVERTERVVSIVSDDTREAVEAYLNDCGLAKYVEGIATRQGSEEEDTGMKASPFASVVTEALLAYAARSERSGDAARRVSVVIGGSMGDIEASKAAGIRCVAYAGNPDEARQFEEAGVTVVVTDLEELAEALNARWDAQWCSQRGDCGC